MRFARANYYVIISTFLLFSCGKDKQQTRKQDTPVSGAIEVCVDESFLPVVKAEVDAFQNLYVNAQIHADYRSQSEAVAALLNGQAEMIFIGRPLNAEEKAFLDKRKIGVQTNKLATDALAFVVHSSYPDTVITLEQLRKIFTGKITRWSDLYPSLPQQTIQIVVDKSASSNLSYLSDSLQLKPDAIQIVAAGSNPKVLEYVQQNQGSIGIIGANWISDEDDPNLKTRLKSLKVLAVGKGEDRTRFFQPLQAHLANDAYPLVRPLYVINKAVKVGLATGFATFILSDRGQRIILKEGLLPAVMPGREIMITK